MGDIADSIINGDMCELCGTWLGNGNGFPQLCGCCRKGAVAVPKKIPCPQCKKPVKQAGLKDHLRVVHEKAKVAT